MESSPLVVLLVAIGTFAVLFSILGSLDRWHRRRAWRQAHTETEREFRERGRGQWR